MTIDVVENDDGTFTVTCGGEEKTVGTPREQKHVVMKSVTIPLVAEPTVRKKKYPITVVPNTGSMSVKIAPGGGSFTTYHLRASTTADLMHLLRTQIGQHKDALTPADVSVTWEGVAAPDTNQLTQMLETFDRNAFTSFNIHTGLTKLGS